MIQNLKDQPVLQAYQGDLGGCHLSGRWESTVALWAVLMFQAWLDEQRDAVRLAV